MYIYMDLNEKINLLYSVVYSKNIDLKYKINQIELDNISINDVKFKHNNSEDYNNLLTEIFLGNFKMLDYNENTLSTTLKKYSNNLSLYVRITPYKNTKDIDSLQSSNNINNFISYILSELVINNKTKHILLPLLNVDVEFQQISDILKNYDSFSIYNSRLQDESITNIFSVNIKENFFKGQYLDHYLKNNECDLKSLLFQIVHTLAVIQKKYEGFKHNKLNFKNVYVYLKKNKNEVNSYEFNEKKFYVKNADLDIKITNFDDAIIPGYYSSNSNVPLYSKKNDYFDLHYFLNYLFHSESFNLDCNKETKEFFNRVLPEKYRNKSNDFYLEKNVEIIKPKDVLKDEYFSEYLEKPKNENKMLSSDNYFTNVKKQSRSLKKDKDKNKNKSLTRRYSKKEIKLKGGGTITELPYNKVLNDPFVSNDKRNTFKTKKEEDTPYKGENKPGFGIYQKNSPFDPRKSKKFKKNKKGKKKFENKSDNNSDKDSDNEFISKRSDSEESTDSENNKYGDPFKTNKEKEAKKIRNEEKPPKREIKSPEVIVEQRVIKNPLYRKDRKPRKREKWEPEYMPEKNYKFNIEYTKPNREERKIETAENSEERPYKPKYSEKRKERSHKPKYSEKREERPDTPRNNYEKQTQIKYAKDITKEPLLAEQKVYQPVSKPGSDHTHPPYSQPAFIPLNSQQTMPPGFVYDNESLPWPHYLPLKKRNEIPLQKIYNINLGNATGNHTMLNTIYEDIIPGDPYTYSMIKLSERIQLIDFIVNTVTQNNPDEFMTLQSDLNMNSIQSFFRILAFNPYNVKNQNPSQNISPPGFVRARLMINVPTTN